jgi:4-amino-4-deoxy-L-arabinose transferase-like glycosyltransferase
MPRPSPTTNRRPSLPGDIPLWMLFPLFFVAVFLSHLTLLRLPYFWDEGGYYIPAAWDLFLTGTLIPQSTVTNAHPPLPSILLAAWWHLSGFVITGTRTLICMVTGAALLAVYRIGRNLAGTAVAVVATLLTAIYPIWFAQSTLAHADIFAAAFTLWAISFYLFPNQSDERNPSLFPTQLWTATLFSLAALSKETAIVTPLALAAWEAFQFIHNYRLRLRSRTHRNWAITLIIPIFPLIIWYAYHYTRTGYVFGNPEYLRYNATANLSPYRILLCLWHRLLHLTTHMNMFVPTLCTIAALFIPTKKPAIPRPTLNAIAVILIANWIAYSVLGGALLTRYLLPLYPLILICGVATWQRHFQKWLLPAALTAAAFLAGIWINPPYAFAPEDNLTYRDMIVLHQQAVRVLTTRFPQATVLTAWPATSELTRPEIGYTRHPVKVFPVQNFSLDQMQQAGAEPGNFDTALIFSTKWEPSNAHLNLGKPNESADTKYFDFHHDLTPTEAAALLHGQIIWQSQRHGEWAAVLHFPRIVDASVTPYPLFLAPK